MLQAHGGAGNAQFRHLLFLAYAACHLRVLRLGSIWDTPRQLMGLHYATVKHCSSTLRQLVLQQLPFDGDSAELAACLRSLTALQVK